MRAMTKQSGTTEVVTMAATDPLNLVGVLIPGDRVASSSGKTVTFVDGVAVDADESAARFPAAAAV